MKLKCNDGVVRNFKLPERKYSFKYGMYESYCEHCGEMFGVHDLKFLKPEWKKHKCKDDFP